MVYQVKSTSNQCNVQQCSENGVDKYFQPVHDKCFSRNGVAGFEDDRRQQENEKHVRIEEEKIVKLDFDVVTDENQGEPHEQTE